MPISLVLIFIAVAAAIVELVVYVHAPALLAFLAFVPVGDAVPVPLRGRVPRSLAAVYAGLDPVVRGELSDAFEHAGVIIRADYGFLVLRLSLTRQWTELVLVRYWAVARIRLRSRDGAAWLVARLVPVPFVAFVLFGLPIAVFGALHRPGSLPLWLGLVIGASAAAIIVWRVRARLRGSVRLLLDALANKYDDAGELTRVPPRLPPRALV